MMANSNGFFSDLIPQSGAPAAPAPRAATPGPRVVIPGKPDTGPAPKDKFADQWRTNSKTGDLVFGQVNLTTNQFTPYKDQPNAPKPITKQQRYDLLNEAVDRIILARKLRENTAGITGTGTFGGMIASLPFGATRAKEAEAVMQKLSNKQLYESVINMYKQTGGKNPFAPMTEFESKVLVGKDLPLMGVDLKDETNIESGNKIEDLNRRLVRGLGFSDAELNTSLERAMMRAGRKPNLPAGASVKRIR